MFGCWLQCSKTRRRAQHRASEWAVRGIWTHRNHILLDSGYIWQQIEHVGRLSHHHYLYSAIQCAHTHHIHFIGGTTENKIIIFIISGLFTRNRTRIVSYSLRLRLQPHDWRRLVILNCIWLYLYQRVRTRECDRICNICIRIECVWNVIKSRMKNTTR